MYYQVQDADNCQTKFILTNKDIELVLPYPKRRKKSVSKESEEDNDYTYYEIINKSLENISRSMDQLSKGNFQHTKSPKDYKCTTYCSFKRICRKDTGKLLSLQE